MWIQQIVLKCLDLVVWMEGCHEGGLVLVEYLICT